MKKYLLFGVIASVLSINAYAVSATVTSKDYVDAMDDEVYNELDASKQNKIPASGTNSETPGDTVVTYTSTAGTIGERGIFDPVSDFDYENNEVATGHEGDLVTADIYSAIGSLYNTVNNLPEAKSTYKTCYEWIENAAHTDANCLLWQLRDQTVYGKCHNHSDCKWLNPECESGLAGLCNSDTGECLCGSR